MPSSLQRVVLLDGSLAWVAYMDDDFNPVPFERATAMKVIGDDGEIVFAKPKLFTPVSDMLDVAHAAGIIFQTPSGHMLLMKREDTGEWSIPAGHLEENEDPRHAAHRESAEETGYPGNHEAYKVDERTTNGVHFHTFLQPVQKPFSPILNSEHTESGWFHGFSLPEPLHPGLKATLGAMDEYGDRSPYSG